MKKTKIKYKQTEFGPVEVGREVEFCNSENHLSATNYQDVFEEMLEDIKTIIKLSPFFNSEPPKGSGSISNITLRTSSDITFDILLLLL